MSEEVPFAHADMLLLCAYICLTTKFVTQPPEAIEDTRLKIRDYLVEVGLLEITESGNYRVPDK